jgi:hypothetical protein
MAFQPHRPDTLRCQTGPSARATLLTAEIATRTPIRSDTCLYTCPCRAASPRTFSASSWPYPKPSPFSGLTAVRVSATTTRFELVCSPTHCLAAQCGGQTRCVRPTSASHCFDYEYPCLACYRHLFEACASPLVHEPALATRRPVDLAFHDARSASVCFLGFTRGLFLRRSRSSRTSDTPVAPVSSCPVLSREGFDPGRQGRCSRLSVKMRRISRPEVPSFVR